MSLPASSGERSPPPDRTPGLVHVRSRAPKHRLDRSEIAAFDRFEVAAFDRFGIATFGVMLSRKGIPKIKYEGPDSHNALAFRFYNSEQAHSNL